MKQTLIGLALCALLAWGVWRQPDPRSGTIQHREIFALGTLVQLSFADPIRTEVISGAQQQLKQFETRWSVLGDGALAQLNRQLRDSPHAELPEALRAGFSFAQHACQISNGLFDPAMGQLVKLWGFDAEKNFRTSPPAPAALEAALNQRSSLCNASIGETIRLDRPGTQLNFGASAKGRAVDEVTAWLKDRGVKNAIINAGGDLKVLGRRPERPWRIGIRHPRPEAGQRVLASLEVADGEAVFSSGDYERYFIHDDRRYHHILDPRDGMPPVHSQSATVVHHSAELADAAATALFVAGPENAAATMADMGIQLYLLIDEQGQRIVSPAMAARLHDPS